MSGVCRGGECAPGPHVPRLVPAGSRGREKGEFTNLQGISTSSAGRIVVADSNNQCVQVWTPLGPPHPPRTPTDSC